MTALSTLAGMTTDFSGTTALVTGASSGLGAEFATQLARVSAALASR